MGSGLIFVPFATPFVVIVILTCGGGWSRWLWWGKAPARVSAKDLGGGPKVGDGTRETVNKEQTPNNLIYTGQLFHGRHGHLLRWSEMKWDLVDPVWKVPFEMSSVFWALAQPCLFPNFEENERDNRRSRGTSGRRRHW